MRITQATRLMVDQLRIQFAVGDVTIHLIAAPFTPTPNAVVADFTEADYTGYAAVNVTEAGPVAWDDELLNGVQSFGAAHFQPTGTTVTNTIYGYWVTMNVLTGGSVTELVDVMTLKEPVPLLSTADALDIVYLFKVGAPAGDA